MYADVDVFISNYTLVDPEIYELWIEGRSCKSPMSIFTPCFGGYLANQTVQYFGS